MPKRPPTLADRLRAAWHRTGDHALLTTGGPSRDRGARPGTDFADRLRAALTNR